MTPGVSAGVRVMVRAFLQFQSSQKGGVSSGRMPRRIFVGWTCSRVSPSQHRTKTNVGQKTFVS